jgi:hypothetical protein
MQTSSGNRKSAPSRIKKTNELLESKEYTVSPNTLISIAEGR